ncbi:MAG: AAA family ATPase [Acetivibrionales bacterium]|jgi:histidine kinase
MFILSGYIIHEKIHEDNETVIYRGHSAKGNMPVIIKVLQESAANQAGISGFINECEITGGLKTEGIVKPLRLEKASGSFALVMEDTGSIPLREHMENGPINITDFLDIAIQLASIVGELHQNGIIHMDLKPENILFHDGTGKVKITGFSKAVVFSSGSINSIIPGSIPENPEYVPAQLPGQAEGADYRIDYYSLGEVFYEMLFARPLSKSEDFTQIRQAVTDAGRSGTGPSVPEAIYSIIMKLVSPNLNEGYQCAYGLVCDLEECRRQLGLTGEIKPFSPGKMDVSPRLELPSGLFGRKAEAEALKAAFSRICGNEPEFILVSGYAGTGKTMLVNEVLKPIASKKGYFAYGKFDQLRQNIPYAPFAAAMGSVIRQLMTESREKLEAWRKKIRRALGQSVAVVAELIPELEMIIGRQPPVETLQPIEAQNRFLMVFGNFIKALAGKDHPLVIFLDDLQWADLSSLQLIRHLCRDAGSSCLLIVGAYRDNEVTEKHPLSVTLERIKSDGTTVRQIYLDRFTRMETTGFIAETLHCSREKADGLARILYRKVCGIPFFLCRLLKSVYDDNIIKYNMKTGCWEWEMEAIHSLQAPDDVEGLVFQIMQKLPEETRDIIKLASCIGNAFELKTLSFLCSKEQDEVVNVLKPAIAEELVLPVPHERNEFPELYHGAVSDAYEFLHDMVRQAAYSLLTEEERKNVHVKAGRLILQNLNHNEIDVKILSILDHINRGLDLVKDRAERLKLAEYNLAAGRKAKGSAAFGPALSYFRAGIELLPDDSWKSCYQLCADLYMERAQCEYLAGDTAQAEQLFDMVIRRMETELERADVYTLMMELYAGTGEYAKAVQIGLNTLKNLGMNMPENPGRLDNAAELILYKWLMRNKSNADLLNIPEMKGPVQRKVAQLLIALILASSTNRPDIYSLAIIKAGNHAVKYGNTDIASIGYLGYGIIEGSVLGNYAAGYKLGKTAMILAEEYGRNLSRCIVYFTMGSLISHWTRHWQEGIQYMHMAAKYAIEAGNMLIIGYSYGVILENKCLMGVCLGEVLDEARKYRNYARRMKHENLAVNAAAYERLASILTDRTKCFIPTSDTGLDEGSIIKSNSGDKASLAAYYFSEILLCYMFGYYHDALSAVERVKGCEDTIIGFMLAAEYNFYHSLSITAVYTESPAKKRKMLRKTLKNNQRKMKKWADSCPANFLHKYLLVEAEMARISGRKRAAEELYDKAVRASHENGYVHIEALACELAAKHYAVDKRKKIERTYIHDAVQLFRKWGAEAKACDLERRYGILTDEAAFDGENNKYDSSEILKCVLQSSARSDTATGNSFDIRTIQEAVWDISEQSCPEELPANFLELAVKSAGASKGCLVLENDDELFVEAICDCKNGKYKAIRHVPLEKSDGISKRAIRYAARTHEQVVINNAGQAGIFAKDPHIASSKAKSMACIPLQLRGVPVGVLYLESNVLTGIFTEERIELLKFLASQMIYAKAMQVFLEHHGNETSEEASLYQVDSLTGKELEVLRLIAAGLLNREIAERLGMTLNTVKTHVRNIYSKLQVNRRVQAVAKAKELGIL